MGGWWLPTNRLHVLKQVIAEFGNVDKVESIYGRARDKEYTFFVFVFVRVSKYDDELITRLVKKEIALEDKYPSMRFVFHYLPAKIDKKDVLSPEFSCLMSCPKH
ncbi:hypothetical protein SAMN00808754_1471 [Thermanaeromonas toyohensis ToBE]|uniref:Uncharacterized protein n=1 Tax=Thermanaeromonas toyohensis ToBE TaxID=698762 RepID=A0A1W1VSN3_9FIRM|nr:hypothetical protein [Thermanaeromonas toyohensis]SMB96377.1 hypothetical protein SAMN00808754_1471 [Thermanaeromonas toyohensis ToBE]